MRKTLLAWSIPVMLPVPLVGHAQVQPTDPNLLQMKLEEANFLLDQRRQQLEQQKQMNATLQTAMQQKDAYWAAYMKGLAPPEAKAEMNPAIQLPVTPEPTEKK